MSASSIDRRQLNLLTLLTCVQGGLWNPGEQLDVARELPRWALVQHADDRPQTRRLQLFEEQGEACVEAANELGGWVPDKLWDLDAGMGYQLYWNVFVGPVAPVPLQGFSGELGEALGQ